MDPRTATDSDGMSPPMTMTVSDRVAVSPASSPASGPSNATASGDQRHVPGQRRACAWRDDDDDLARERPHGVDRVAQEWAAGEWLGELVPAEPAERPPARTMTLIWAVAHDGPSAARGPGTWPASVRRRIPRRSRSVRMAMTYLRLVPVASRNAAGVSGARDEIASAGASIVR